MTELQNIPWMADLPKGWNVRRAKYLFRQMRRPIRPEDDVVTAFRDGQVTLRKNRRTEGFTFAEKEIGYHGVRQGDLVIHAMDAFAGAVGVSDSDGKMSPVCSICQPYPGMDSRYYAALLRHMSNAGFIHSLSRGIRERSTDFRFAQFADLPLLVPPNETQRVIADFLDRKTAAIDALIQKKEKLIELLEEKRAALINQAVTKGLDPNVPMKDSGVPWIGEIPAHWQVRRLKTLVSEVVDCLHSTPVYSEDGSYPAIRTADISPGFLDFENARRIEEDAYLERVRRSKPRSGDIIYSREGERFGIAAMVPENVKLCLAQRVMQLRPRTSVESRYLMWALNSRSVYHQASQDTVGATSPRVNMETVANVWIAIPAYHEQAEISAHISAVAATVLRLTSKTTQQIRLLGEYRQSCISSAVVGTQHQARS